MSNKETNWKKFNSNQRNFFALWTKTEEIGKCNFIYDKEFYDDILFNHLENIKLDKLKNNDEIFEYIKKSEKLKINPCVFISPLTEPDNLKNLLIKIGFKQSDKILVMRNRNHNFKYDIRFKLTNVNKNTLEDWINCYMKSFEISEKFRNKLNNIINNIYQNKKNKFFLSTLDNNIVGCLILFSDNKIGGIYCVGTNPEYRNIGVASFILNSTIKHSTQIGNTETILQTLLSDQLDIFYKKRQFEIEYYIDVYLKKNNLLNNRK